MKNEEPKEESKDENANGYQLIGTIKIDLREALKLGEFPTPKVREPPSVATPAPSSVGESEKGRFGEADGLVFAFSPDFRTLDWGDDVYIFTTSQALILEGLYTQWISGVSYASGDFLITECLGSSGSRRMKDIFRDSPGWNKVILKIMVSGESSDLYRLFCADPKNVKRRKGGS